jgi:hypothetical protein
MERGSAQHGSRVDDELAHESAAVVHGAVIPSRERAELEPEALTEDEHLASPDAGLTDAADGPTHAQVVARSELARWLLPSAFPAGAAALVAVARSQDAPDDVVGALATLPATTVYETVGALWSALGGETEHRPTVADEAPTAPTVVEPAPAPVPDTPDPHLRALVPPQPEGSLVDLVTLPARVALGALRFVVGTVGRGLSTIATAHQSS